jgi:hypothetical protein
MVEGTAVLVEPEVLIPVEEEEPVVILVQVVPEQMDTILIQQVVQVVVAPQVVEQPEAQVEVEVE